MTLAIRSVHISDLLRHDGISAQRSNDSISTEAGHASNHLRIRTSVHDSGKLTLITVFFLISILIIVLDRLKGQYAIPHPDLTKLHQLALQHSPLVPGQNQTAAAVAAAAAAAYGMPQAALQVAPAPPPPPTAGSAGTHRGHEMSIPNELIGCIIGKGGAKINEIRYEDWQFEDVNVECVCYRQLSGATIKISNTEEGSKDRTVVIAGTAPTVFFVSHH